MEASLITVSVETVSLPNGQGVEPGASGSLEHHAAMAANCWKKVFSFE